MPEVIKKESRKQKFSSLVTLSPDKSDDVFGCLTCKELKLIRMHAVMREIRKKETIYFQGDADNSLYMLDSGVVKLTKITPKGKQLIADIFGKKTMFGGITDIDTFRRDESAIVIEDGLLYTVSKESICKIEERAPKLAIKMKCLVEDRRRKSANRLVDILFYTVEQRFARMLLNLIYDFGFVYKGGYLLDILLTHQNYSDFIGSTRETVTTILNRLRKNSIIDYERKKIVIRSLDKLKKIALLA
jgi:CRP/FNR family transcriptional regulator